MAAGLEFRHSISRLKSDVGSLSRLGEVRVLCAKQEINVRAKHDRNRFDR